MSVNTETGSAQGQTTVLEKEGVYASLFEKINLTPASSLGDINAFLDDAALADASAGERLPGTAHQLISTLSAVLLKYEPRLRKITVVMLEQTRPGELRYAIDAELKGIGLVRYGTEFMPEGKILIRHMKQQQYLDVRAAI